MTRQHYSLTFAVLMLAGLAYTVLTSLVAPALRSLALDLHTTPTAATWLLTAPFLSAAVATPIIGKLGDMFGQKRVLVLTLAVMALGTLVSALASSLSVMLVGRVIQGFGAGVFPVSFAIIRDEFPRERAATSTGILPSLFGVGAGLGIVITGPILDHLSYHWLFWIPFAGTVVAMLAALPLVPESPIRTPGMSTGPAPQGSRRGWLPCCSRSARRPPGAGAPAGSPGCWPPRRYSPRSGSWWSGEAARRWSTCS